MKYLSDKDERDLAEMMRWWRMNKLKFERLGIQPPRTKKGGASTEGDCCDISCCSCEKSNLYVSIENDSISWELLKPSNVDGGNITHTIKLTCGTDGATRNVVLDALSCSTTDCKTLDMTGQYVGVCEIGEIDYGNDTSCATPPEGCNNLPPYSASASGLVETHGSLGPKYLGGFEGLYTIFRPDVSKTGRFDCNLQSSGALDYQHVINIEFDRASTVVQQVQLIALDQGSTAEYQYIWSTNGAFLPEGGTLGSIDGSAHDFSLRVEGGFAVIYWDDVLKFRAPVGNVTDCQIGQIGRYQMINFTAGTSQLALNSWSAEFE